MSPAACHAPPDLLATPGGGAASVVRMKSSLEQFERRDHVAEALRVAVGELLRRRAPAAIAVCCIFRPCSSVPVRKNTSLPSSRCEAGDRVGRQRRIGVADMRDAVRIEDRRRDVESRPVGHPAPRILDALRNPGPLMASAELSRRSSTNCLRSRLYSSTSWPRSAAFSHSIAQVTSGTSPAARFSRRHRQAANAARQIILKQLHDPPQARLIRGARRERELRLAVARLDRREHEPVELGAAASLKLDQPSRASAGERRGEAAAPRLGKVRRDLSHHACGLLR